ncbi:conserved hypothetical protein [Talaromyces stipitatus ATCC 10500]|uniref:Uncharacterized protein n=1 Tax=Talaromyces stipitatus (strain ATCC 10500 / CBS 375.48 / QM 6759 / NRRL 1006) TaxID=441959 RepID=B8LTV3_TALSN|nr:uncharacterized protein TSTA_071790 [Talaromyces stipitatus ATCC 10500]EED23783.1 conserved hypothetical protein [Talaromyces stipitatus ATCC 10500]
MFVPYTGPSNQRNPKARRAANAFKAARGASRAKGGHGTLQWVQVPDSSSEDSSESSTNETPSSLVIRASKSSSSRAAEPAPLPKFVLGGQKFYPYHGMGGKGPLTTTALSRYFDILLPDDCKAQGIDVSRGAAYGGGLLKWIAQHDGVLHGLTAFALCSLETVGKTDAIYQAILHHRHKILEDVHRRLERRQVDDVLIQAICLLIPVDDYLGYVEYGPVHRSGLSNIVKIRGGFRQVGNSDMAFGNLLQTSMLVVMSMIDFHVQTRIAPMFLPDERPMASISLSSEMQKRIFALPSGFQTLVHAGILSTNVLVIVESYEAWLLQVKDVELKDRATWRPQLLSELNNVEKCVVVTLVCLADDISSLGFHAAAPIFRKPKQRSEALTDVPELWADPALVDCVIWMSTVISTPRNSRSIDPDFRKEVLKRSIRGRDFALDWEQIQRKLRRFFYAEERAGDWEKAWNLALGEPWLFE